MFLNEQELLTLTDYSYSALQIGWLRANGFTFIIGGKGNPKVLVSHVEARLNPGTTVVERVEPNWAAL